MKLQTLIATLKNTEASKASTKTASESTAPVAPAAPAPAETKLAATLREATAEATKTASEAPAMSVAAEVLKVAAEMADAEQELALKEAALLGAAFADSAVQRFAEWQKAAGSLEGTPVKTASFQPAQPQADAVFTKFAAENPVQARQALALGYAPTEAGLEKMAHESYVQGYNDQVTEIFKVAQDEFLKGAAQTSLLLERARTR